MRFSGFEMLATQIEHLNLRLQTSLEDLIIKIRTYKYKYVI